MVESHKSGNKGKSPVHSLPLRGLGEFGSGLAEKRGGCHTAQRVIRGGGNRGSIKHRNLGERGEKAENGVRHHGKSVPTARLTHRLLAATHSRQGEKKGGKGDIGRLEEVQNFEREKLRTIKTPSLDPREV